MRYNHLMGKGFSDPLMLLVVDGCLVKMGVAKVLVCGCYFFKDSS